MSTKIRLRRDTASNWVSNNPLLDSGEYGIEIDTDKYKIGNGYTAWVDLKYQVIDTANTFTAPQRGTILVLEDDTSTLNFTTSNNYNVTLTEDTDILVDDNGTNGCVGQGGVITVINAEHITGWGEEFKWKTEPTDLDGTERFSYFIEAEDTIAIGRVQ